MQPRAYYAVLKREIFRDGITFRAGHIVMVRKREGIDGLVDVWSAPIHRGEMIKVAYSEHQCRDLFTKPTLDLDAAIEEAIMVCEANYC